MVRALLLFLLLATMAFLAAACSSSGPNLVFTLYGEAVYEEQIRTEFRAAFLEGEPGLLSGCQAAASEDDLGVIEFAAGLIGGDVSGGAEPESLDLDRLIKILNEECVRLEQ